MARAAGLGGTSAARHPPVGGGGGGEGPGGRIGDGYFRGGGPVGYLGHPGQTAEPHTRPGWATVGDMGSLDDDGYLFLTDRRHHTIISGGVNVYPQEAESALVSHPRVADAAVFGVPDPAMGQAVVGVVETVDPAD